MALASNFTSTLKANCNFALQEQMKIPGLSEHIGVAPPLRETNMHNLMTPDFNSGSN